MGSSQFYRRWHNELFAFRRHSAARKAAPLGTAELDLYSDTGQGGSPVGTLTPPKGYSMGLAQATFAGNGLSLSPNSTYWLVLKASSGQFEWGWTDSDAGSGIGFTHTWGLSDDAGRTWLTSDVAPVQFSVRPGES